MFGCDSGDVGEAGEDAAALCGNGILDPGEPCDASADSKHCSDECAVPSYVFAIGTDGVPDVSRADERCAIAAADINLPNVEYRAYLDNKLNAAPDRIVHLPSYTSTCGGPFSLESYRYSEVCTSSAEHVGDVIENSLILLSTCDVGARALNADDKIVSVDCSDVIPAPIHYFLCVAQD